ncbi:protein mono-ADP-ribosyltransferase PARP9 [Spea bombifrons]|uniref:protein mono-ADP-ribosyltransferase PARP9 n=1 Tax=Spea bombifrons TaxID=233779 RepID=UPI00234A35D7|nr:protein mono-ADP-ribosyltransferase PARP9 [Spea bombifrons]
MSLQGPRAQKSLSSSESPVLFYEKNVGGCKITTWKGDMTKQDADAVVNAANEDLQHVGGIAWALAEAGGPQVQRESARYMSNHGRIPTGSVAVTSGGNLPCKQIIHAVGPRWDRSSPAKCESQLEDAIKSVLSHVNRDHRIRSVAIPAVSSGIFGFPLDGCAEIIVRTAASFCSRVKCDHLREIRFVNNDDRTVGAMTRACEQILGPGDHPRASLEGASQPVPAPTSSHRAPFSAESFGINGLKLHLQVGCIEDQSSTVIVNSISSDLNLSFGRISNAILQRAGSQLQEEINRFKQRRGSSLIPTKGFGLPCEYVYHVILTSYSGSATESDIGEAIYACLARAQKHGSRSISFPALGSGLLGFHKPAVAEIMTQTVVQFAQEAVRTLDVHFVIHPGDSDMFTILKATLQRMPGVFPIQAAEPQGPGVSVEEICAIIRGPSYEDVLEAENWLEKSVLSHETTNIRNNHIVLFGEKEHDALAEAAGVEIAESLADGIFSLSVTGNAEEKVRAVVQVEKDLLRVQEELLRMLEEDLIQNAVRWSNVNGTQRHQNPDPITPEKGSLTQGPLYSAKSGSQERVTAPWPPLVRETLDGGCPQFQEKKNEFTTANLTLLKVRGWLRLLGLGSEMERIENGPLAAVNRSKRGNKDFSASGSGVRTLYMRVPAECCRLICRVGFHRLYSCAVGSKYGAGIYFHRSLTDALEGGAALPDPGSLVYIFQAEVTVGKFTEGRSSCPLPPAVGSDELELYGSLVDSASGPKTFVIFDRYRALPRFLFTCKWNGPRGSYV